MNGLWYGFLRVWKSFKILASVSEKKEGQTSMFFECVCVSRNIPPFNQNLSLFAFSDHNVDGDSSRNSICWAVASSVLLGSIANDAITTIIIITILVICHRRTDSRQRRRHIANKFVVVIGLQITHSHHGGSSFWVGKNVDQIGPFATLSSNASHFVLVDMFLLPGLSIDFPWWFGRCHHDRSKATKFTGTASKSGRDAETSDDWKRDLDLEWEWSL